MTGRKFSLPKGAKIGDDGKLVLPPKKPRDASQAKAWAKSKGKRRVVSKAAAAALNSIGKRR